MGTDKQQKIAPRISLKPVPRDTIEEYGRVIKKRNYWPKTYWKRQNPKDVGDLDLPGSWRIM